MTAFYYEVVTANGHGVHATVLGPLAEAQEAAASVAARWSLPGDVFELQWVVERNGGRRYFMREGSRWVPWASRRDHEVRKPDWSWVSGTTASTREEQ